MATTSTERAVDGVVPERWALGDNFVPKGRYIDRDFARLEHDRLFTQTWQMACRERAHSTSTRSVTSRSSWYARTTAASGPCTTRADTGG
jgi:hypothetical protein